MLMMSATVVVGASERAIFTSSSQKGTNASPAKGLVRLSYSGCRRTENYNLEINTYVNN